MPKLLNADEVIDKTILIPMHMSVLQTFILITFLSL